MDNTTEMRTYKMKQIIPLVVTLGVIAIETGLLITHNCVAHKPKKNRVKELVTEATTCTDKRVADQLCFEDWRRPSVEFWSPEKGYDIHWIDRNTSNLQLEVVLRPPRNRVVTNSHDWGILMVYLFDVWENIFSNITIPYEKMLVLIKTNHSYRGYYVNKCNLGPVFVSKLATFNLEDVLVKRYVRLNIRPQK